MDAHKKIIGQLDDNSDVSLDIESPWIWAKINGMCYSCYCWFRMKNRIFRSLRASWNWRWYLLFFGCHLISIYDFHICFAPIFATTIEFATKFFLLIFKQQLGILIVVRFGILWEPIRNVCKDDFMLFCLLRSLKRHQICMPNYK